MKKPSKLNKTGQNWAQSGTVWLLGLVWPFGVSLTGLSWHGFVVAVLEYYVMEKY